MAAGEGGDDLRRNAGCDRADEFSLQRARGGGVGDRRRRFGEQQGVAPVVQAELHMIEINGVLSLAEHESGGGDHFRLQLSDFNFLEPCLGHDIKRPATAKTNQEGLLRLWMDEIGECPQEENLVRIIGLVRSVIGLIETVVTQPVAPTGVLVDRHDGHRPLCLEGEFALLHGVAEERLDARSDRLGVILDGIPGVNNAHNVDVRVDDNNDQERDGHSPEDF